MSTENFTTYIEQDATGSLVVSADSITGQSIRTRDSDYWVYKDFGVNSIGDFFYGFEISFSNPASVQMINYLLITNQIGDGNDQTLDDAVKLDYYYSANKFRIYDFLNNALAVTTFTPSQNTIYYVTLERSGATLTAKFYSDQQRTALLDTLSITCSTTAYRYITLMAGWNNAANNLTINASIKNLDLLGVIPPPIPQTSTSIPAKVKQNIMNVYPHGLKQNHHNCVGNNITTYNGYQYVGLWDENKNLVLCKRALSDSIWDAVIHSNITLTGDDNHDSISIGFDTDGYLHIAYDHHNDALKYRRSASPEDISSLTGLLPMLGQNELNVTYPVFWRDKNGTLHFQFRDGISGDGDFYLYQYQKSNQAWNYASGITNGLMIQGKPDDANAYVSNPFIDANNDAWFTFQWRTGGSGTGLDEDISIIRYDLDTGLVYRHDGTAQALPITRSNMLAYETTLGTEPPVHKKTTAIDSLGNVYFVYGKTDSKGYRQVYFTRRINGEWKETQQLTNSFVLAPVVPFQSDKRAKLASLLIGSDDTLYVLSMGGQEGRQIHVYESKDKGGTWEMYAATFPNVGEWNGNNFDYELWESSNRLNMVMSFLFDRTVIYPKQPVHLIEWEPGIKYPQNTDYGFVGYHSVTVKSEINSELN